MAHQPSPAQRRAIEAPLGPVLVVAGPGAGKTFCLIERVRYLIAELALPPERICAVTFTNKAAEEIAGRLHGELDSAAESVHRGTLHALCVEILRAQGQPVGVERGFGIADEPYQRLVLRRLGVPRNRAGQLLTLFSLRRLQGLVLIGKDEALFSSYRAHLQKRSLLDFDDLIARTAELFRRHPAVAQAVAATWDYVLVDEFQDLDPTQYTVLKALVAPHRNLFGVGDDEQSIFAWRGADPQVLTTFAREFEITQPVVLDENRRCARQIHEAARRLLAVQPSLFAKDLRAERETPFPVRAYSFVDDNDETAWLLEDLRRDRDGAGLDWGDYAVLYRRHWLGNALESAFLRAGIPCRLARGRALQDDPVVGFVVAALRLMHRPDDPLLVEAFAQIVLPEQLVERVRLDAQGSDRDFLGALREFARAGVRGDPDVKRAWRFVYHVENLRGMYQAHPTLDGIIEELLSQRAGPYQNVLEDLHEELTDPGSHPEAIELADELADALDGRRQVWVDGEGGVQIAMRGLLLESGVTRAAYLTAAEPVTAADVIVRTDPLTLFKALQLVHARDMGREFTDFVAFDLETTDKDAATCEIVEVGAARVRRGEIVEQFRSLVRPTIPIPASATRIHGFTDADVADAPSFGDLWPRFRSFVGDDLLVAHNGQEFDVPVLLRQARGLPGVDELVFYDSLLLARSLYRSGAKLETLAARFGIDVGQAHHALDDAVTLARVFGELGRQKLSRARKASLVNVLGSLALGLALHPTADLTDEGRTLLKAGAPFALGRYGTVLEFYAEERHRLGYRDLPSVDRVIDLLGGRRRMELLRRDRTAEQRYPEAYARLRTLLQASRAETVAASLDRLLQHVALSTSEGVEVDPHRVNLLTLHATKGLEFSRIYIVGAEDYQLPGYYQTVDNRTDEIEESRRLLYVGMTRARDRLVLTRVERRGGRDAGGHRYLDEMGVEPTPP